MNESLEKINDAFLAAPFLDNGWQSALALLANETKSSWANLLAVGGAREVQFNCLSALPSDNWFEQFREIDGGNAAVNWRVAVAGRPFSLASERDYELARQRMKAAVYDDFTRQYDMSYGCQTTLYQKGGSFFGLATLRSLKDGPTKSNDRKLFSAISPTVLSAIKLQYVADHKAEQIVKGTLEQLSASAFVCDVSSKVLNLTAHAEALLRKISYLKLTQGRLVFSKSSDDARFRRALAEVIGGCPSQNFNRVWFASDCAEEAGCFIEIFKLPQTLGFDDFHKRAVVVVKQGNALELVAVPQLSEIFGLTKAEAEVALQVANGVERDHIAHVRSTSLGTINSQLKSIFRKADVVRETELAAKINQLLR